MRKNRFLINLIAATAIGLAAVGCTSSDSGGLADTSDIVNATQANTAQQQNSLREYLFIGQRGLNAATANFGTGQSAPTPATGATIGDVVAAPGDADVDRAQIWEINGIGDTPVANNVITAPGGGTTPSTPTANPNTTGAHGVFTDPTGNFVITLGRTRNRGFTTDTIVNSELQIHRVAITPIDQTFPPVVTFGAVSDPVPTLLFSTNQGAFVSGAWSTDAKFFYAGIEGSIRTFAVDGTVGRLTQVDSDAFPAGGTGFNNPVELLPSPNGNFLFAIDHANNNILTYTRTPATGAVTLTATTPVTTDPRGMTIDSTGTFLYSVSRSSQTVQGFRMNPAGTLTAIELIAGAGPTPINLGAALGDVDANPVHTQLYVATYAGVVQSYNINTATGAITPVGASDDQLGTSRNTANIEVEPTGKFLFSVNEHDWESFDAFTGEFPVFANIVTGSNDASATPPGAIFSPTAQTDANGQVVFLAPTTAALAFTGDFQSASIAANGDLRFTRQQAVINPYGLSFVQKVFTR